MSGRRYARGKKAVGICQRSGKKVFRQDMLEDGQVPGLLVAKDWWEPRHPQEFPVDAGESMAIYRPSPDESDGGTPIPLLTASWAPAPVDEAIDIGGSGAQVYTLSASGGAAPYSYLMYTLSGSPVQVEPLSANTFRFIAPDGAAAGTYSITVVGRVTDAIGFQAAASFQVEITLAPSTFGAVMALLAPDHWWKLNDDYDATFADSGFGPDPINNGTGLNDQLGRTAPGMRVGETPQHLAINNAGGNASYVTLASVFPSHTTGSIFAIKRWRRLNAPNDSSVISQGNSTAAQGAGIRVTSTGEVQVYVDRPAGNMRVTTDAPVYDTDDREWHQIGAVQPGDGTGPKIYIDGALVASTLSLTGSSTADDWFDDIPSATVTRIGSFGGVAAGSFLRGQMSDVAVWIDRLLSASDFADLYTTSIGGTVVSFYDYVKVNLNPLIWLTMVDRSNPNVAIVEAGRTTLTQASHSFPSEPTFRNAGPLTVDPDYAFGGGQAFLLDHGLPPGSRTTGTFIAFFRSSSFAGYRVLADYYDSANSNTEFFRFEIENSLFQAHIQSGSGNSYKVQISGLTLAVDNWHMAAVVQPGDGGGFRMFIDGVRYSGGDLTVTGPSGSATVNDWINRIIALGGTDFFVNRSGFGLGSSSMEYTQIIFTDEVLTDQEVADLYAAR